MIYMALILILKMKLKILCVNSISVYKNLYKYTINLKLNNYITNLSNKVLYI